MKYSLRSLMIVVTLVCGVLGIFVARIEYLRGRAVFHEEEARRYTMPETDAATAEKRYSHTEIARDFRSAIARPWAIVSESPRPIPSLPQLPQPPPPSAP